MTGHRNVGFDHLVRLADQRGLYEHAKLTVRRDEHGYCTDDNARLLVVAARESAVGPAGRLGCLALDFVLDAQTESGATHNRMDRSGSWTDEASTEDCWGRSLWSLGVTAAHHRDPSMRSRALEAFVIGCQQRSPWSRAMAFAALGAADVITSPAGATGSTATAEAVQAATELVTDALVVIGVAPAGPWRWPENRLRYANATLAEAVIAGGAAIGDRSALARGLEMLAWLLEVETRHGHLSVTGVEGRGPDDESPQFDQQSIEVSAMADACWRAATITGERQWARGVELCARWFEGDNDTGATMHDPGSGGGYDGLQAVGVNLNQGAESTLAFVSTMQRAASFAMAR